MAITEKMVTLIRGLFGNALKTQQFSPVRGDDRLSADFEGEYFYRA